MFAGEFQACPSEEAGTSFVINVYDITQAVVQGDDYAVICTITTNGATFNLTDYTVTCSIYDERDQATKLITDHAVTITTAVSGIVTLTLLAAESALLHVSQYKTKGVFHVLDFKCVAPGGGIVRSDPVRLEVRDNGT